ncbi:hypothetical protein C3E98_008320 [Pseudomonas sp. MWU13-2625]|nr:hypothetical protein C3E97_017675 [Pseudomonas sp. MWU12-2115]RBL71602.1 hypothetical protein C3E98_008320 [Pseudomonas sp. MWU13-2625]
MVSDYAMTKRFRGAEVYLLADYPVGAGLLAKGPCQSKSLLNDPPHSRASPLLQVDLRQGCDIGATVRRILSG